MNITYNNFFKFLPSMKGCVLLCGVVIIKMKPNVALLTRYVYIINCMIVLITGQMLPIVNVQLLVQI